MHDAKHDIRHQYVHGYSGQEQVRLLDQANTLAELLHDSTRYPPGAHVLEAGCGVGAQTAILARNSPAARFTSIDISLASIEIARTSLAAARATAAAQDLAHVAFRQADIFHLPFAAQTFDHVFVCFVLEHLQQPIAALQHLQAVLKPGGTLTVIEGDHGSAYFYPPSRYAQRAIDCLVELQSRMGGNSLIGRQLYPLLCRAGFQNVSVSPRQVYADAGRPAWVEGFTKNTFTAMIAGAREQALAQGLIAPGAWDQGIADLYATAGAEGTFSYTFFKGIAVR
ncbi:MAG: methyltransferase domain-containing protein [Caldilineaceae bacterium]